jgi:tetratricopeptide (TPR) repeat protein
MQERDEDVLNLLEGNLGKFLSFDDIYQLIKEFLQSDSSTITEYEDNLLQRIRANPQSVNLKIIYACYLELSNQFQEAIDQYQKILDIYPEGLFKCEIVK